MKALERERGFFSPSLSGLKSPAEYEDFRDYLHISLEALMKWSCVILNLWGISGTGPARTEAAPGSVNTQTCPCGPAPGSLQPIAGVPLGQRGCSPHPSQPLVRCWDLGMLVAGLGLETPVWLLVALGEPVLHPFDSVFAILQHVPGRDGMEVEEDGDGEVEDGGR